MTDVIVPSSYRLESLIDFLSEVTQVFRANRLDNLLFLVREGECLTKITIRKRLFWLSEQGLAKLIAHDRSRKQTMQSSTFDDRFAE